MWRAIWGKSAPRRTRWFIGIFGPMFGLLVSVGGGSALAASQPSGPGFTAIASDGSSFCALTTSGGVDCWGEGEYGQLGDGKFYTSGNQGSAVPVHVKGVGGTGTLTGVAALVTGGNAGGYCALLTSGGVDCWGYGYVGQLGDGHFYHSGNQGLAVPVAVEGVGGAGILSGVASLTSDGGGYCALLTSTGVDCWGDGYIGELGDGHFTPDEEGSAVPVQVEGADGAGILSGVASLTTDNTGYCAALTSGGVDCWGYGYYGDLGNGVFYSTGRQSSAVPVHVEGVGGAGLLTGVSSLTAGGNSSGYCALLTSGDVDCWGNGSDGQLGNGHFYFSGNQGSAVPVHVKNIGRAGLLSGVASLTGDGDSYCALTTSAEADCWGDGALGELGNGHFYTGGPPIPGSAVPVHVKGAGGTGILTGVSALIAGGLDAGYCAVLTSSGVDCWGDGYDGQLGNGHFYTSGTQDSEVPVLVKGVGGAGTLAGVASLTSDTAAYCTVMTSGGADCWGNGYYGQLGDGIFYTSGNNGSAVPVQVK